MNWTRFWEVRGPEIVAERMRQNMARVAHPRNYGATTWSEAVHVFGEHNSRMNIGRNINTHIRWVSPSNVHLSNASLSGPVIKKNAPRLNIAP
jgi:hypothetical protein